MALTMSELSGLGQVPKRVLSIAAYNRFVREFGPNMAKDLNLTWKGAPSSFDRQRELMVYREIANTPMIDLRVPSPRVTATRRYYDDGDLEEDTFDLELSPKRARESRIVTGRPYRPRTEQGRARRSPVGAPFQFAPGARPSEVFPGGRGTQAEILRDQILAAARHKKRVNVRRLEPLRTSSAAARLQMREMAARGAKVVKPETWTAVAYDKRPLVASAQSKQNGRLKSLTKDSAGFRQMTNTQKADYLTKMRSTFQGNAAFSSMLSRYNKRAKKDRAVKRRQDKHDAWAGGELLAVMEKRANPVEWEIRNEQARKQAAIIRARGALDQVRHKDVSNMVRLPGYDRIPHQKRVVRARVPARARGIPGIAPPPLPPKARKRAPIRRPTTGGGVVYGQQAQRQALMAQQARQGSHGRIVAGGLYVPRAPAMQSYGSVK